MTTTTTTVRIASSARNAMGPRWVLTLAGANLAIFVSHADAFRALMAHPKDGSVRLVRVTYKQSVEIAARMEAMKAA